MESEIASFSKFAAVWYRSASTLEINTVRKLICSVVIQTFYLTCTSTGSLSDQFYQVSIANRLWPVTNSVHWIANVVHVNSSDSFWTETWKIFCSSLYGFGPRFDNTNLLKYLCVSRSSVVAHDKVIILSLPCNLSQENLTRSLFFISLHVY